MKFSTFQHAKMGISPKEYALIIFTFLVCNCLFCFFVEYMDLVSI